MPRYADWFRKVGDTAASPRALDAAKKLLGYLNIRRGTPGVDTLVQKVTLDDGTVVTAAFYGDQPTVTVDTTAVGGETCTLYVESGMLDLGPNIASDANNRFNRGLPEFDDRPATLYFGDGVDCQQGQGGFNGRIKVRGKTITSDCLPKQGNSVESRLRDPVKKQAQALFPASCWSGLMQRYVQAVYGGDALEYSATATALTIAGKTFDVKDSWGLVDIGGTLRFVKIANGSAQFYKVKPTTPCFAAVLKAWRAMPSTTEQRKSRDKMLTVALSGCTVGAADGAPVTAPNDENRHFKDRAAFVFSAKRPRAVGVMQPGIEHADRRVSVLELSFTIGDTGAAFSVATLESIEAPEGDVLFPSVLSGSPFSHGTKQAKSGLQSGDGKIGSSALDVPLYAYYTSADAVDVVRSTIALQSSLDAAPDYCSAGYHYSTYAVAWRTSVGAGNACAGVAPDMRVLDAAYGIYCGAWSTVRKRPFVAIARDDGTYNIISRSGLKFYALASDMALSEGVRSVSRWGVGINVPFIGPDIPACYMRNRASGDGTVFFVPLEDCDGFIPDDCSNHYVWNSLGPITGTLTYDYIAGRINQIFGSSVALHEQVFTLAWGSHSIACVDEYDFTGSYGAYFSYPTSSIRYGATYGYTGIGKTAEFSTTANVQHFVANPAGGYCGGLISESSSTISVPLSHSYSGGYTMEAPYYLSGPNVLISDMFGNKDEAPFVTGDSPDSGQTFVSAYPCALARGTERRASLVANAGETTKETQVSISIPASEASDRYTDDVRQGDYVGFTPDEASDLCPMYGLAGMGELRDEHQEAVFDTDTVDADAIPYALQVAVRDKTFMDGCDKVARMSLLRAMTLPIPTLDRGASINMDRETITGGYPKVNTPSFVGWA